ncbi:MAG: response regulator transcription factor, partial [Delftia sp.]|nr:response regulator transcription factor [Delftia sp.]
RPWLCVAHAWALAYSGQLDAVEPLLQDAERGMDSLDKASTEAPVLSKAKVQHTAGHIATIRSYVVELDGNYPASAKFARQALELLPEDDLATRGFAAWRLSYALRASDGLAAATQAALEASAISQAAGDSHVAVMALCDLAWLLSLQGRLHEAADTYRDALRLTQEYASRSGRQLPVTGYVYGRMSTIQREWNDLQAAVRLARKGVELCQRWGWTEAYADCCLYLALALLAAGDGQEALDVIQRAKQAARALSPWYATAMDMFEVSIQLALGDVARAVRWAATQENELDIGDEPDVSDSTRYLLLVLILIEQAWVQTDAGRERVAPDLAARLESALESLSRLLTSAEAHNKIARATEAQIRQALILQVLGRVDQAVRVLERVLSITESEGHVRAFVSKGAPMAKLLRQTAARGIAVERVGRLLAAFGQPKHPSPLIEPLTEREIEVLRLVAAGLSNREIADELFVTVGTVKRHVSNVYGKLNVNKRTQAVARARELGLL